jgi:hypothetical protein
MLASKGCCAFNAETLASSKTGSPPHEHMNQRLITPLAVLAAAYAQ